MDFISVILTEMKFHVNRTCFHVGLKSQTGMSSFRLSCECTLSFKESKETELLLLKKRPVEIKERKYELIDLFNSLNLIEDSDGLLKVKGRLENSTLQLPILLNKDSHLIKLIIWRSHVQRFHSRSKDTLNHVRQKYCVTRGRQTVKGMCYLSKTEFKTV